MVADQIERMSGKISIAGMAPRPRGRPARAAPSKPPAEEPSQPAFLHLDVLEHVLSYLASSSGRTSTLEGWRRKSRFDRALASISPVQSHLTYLFVLQEVSDLCRAACVSREWRAAAAAAQAAWRQAFVEEFGEEKAQDFAQLRSWRDKYMCVAGHQRGAGSHGRSGAQASPSAPCGAAFADSEGQCLLKTSWTHGGPRRSCPPRPSSSSLASLPPAQSLPADQHHPQAALKGAVPG